MPKIEGYTGPKHLVYQVDEKSDKVIFADREKALYVAQLWQALTFHTWAEFRAKVPSGRMDDFLEHFADEFDAEGNPVDSFPTGDEPFGPHFVDGYPEWLAESMFSLLPEDVIDKYVLPAPFCSGHVPAGAAQNIVAELREQGCTVEPSPVFLI